MRYVVAAVGQLKRGFYANGCDFYTDRLSKLAKVEVIEIKEKAGDAARQITEASEALLARTEATYRIALDETGNQLTSEQLAERLTTLENNSISKMGLLIGGADGHSDELRAQSDELWSLSQMTLPHEMARLVLLEQLYRAETIRAGHPYHRR